MIFSESFCNERSHRRVGDHHEHNIADGEGPVHAMDQVLRKSLLPHYPVLKDIALTDYQVRIVNPSMATGVPPPLCVGQDGQAWVCCAAMPPNYPLVLKSKHTIEWQMQALAPQLHEP